MYKRYALLLLLIVKLTFAHADEPWALSTNKEGIKVYTRHVSNSKVKAIKVECYLDATASQLVSVLMDINGSQDWVYHTKSVSLIK